MSRSRLEESAINAKIYVGKKLCGTMPARVERSKDYTFDCEAVGDFVKIVTGRIDGNLSFSNLKVYPEYDTPLDIRCKNDPNSDV